MSAPSRPRGDLRERILLVLVAAVALAAAWLDAASETARRLREGEPVAFWLALHAEGSDPAGPPELYLAAYAPLHRRLEILYLPPGALGRAPADAYRKARRWPGGEAEAAAAMSRAAEPLLQPGPAPGPWAVPWTLRWELPRGAGDPASPEAVRDWISSWPRDSRFWLGLPRAIGALLRQARPAPSVYDALLLAREAQGLRGPLRLSWLPPPGGSGRLMRRLLEDGRPPEPPRPLPVAVLNASGEPGVALQATKVLRLQGRDIDVVDFGNAPEGSESTRFVDLTGAAEAAEEVARALGCPEEGVLTRMEDPPRAAVLVLLGRDYRRCSGLAPAPGPRR